MSSQATRRTNGKTAAPVCRHSPDCEVAQTQRDLQAQVQAGQDGLVAALGAVSEELRRLIEQVELISKQVERIAGTQSELGRRVTVVTQREELNGRLITALVRHFTKEAGPEAGKALATEFAAVQAQAARELGGEDA